GTLAGVDRRAAAGLGGHVGGAGVGDDGVRGQVRRDTVGGEPVVPARLDGLCAVVGVDGPVGKRGGVQGREHDDVGVGLHQDAVGQHAGVAGDGREVALGDRVGGELLVA